MRGPGDSPIGPGSQQALNAFLKMLGAGLSVRASGPAPVDSRKSFDIAARQDRQVGGMQQRVQAMVRDSDHVRNEFFWDKLVPYVETEPWNMKLHFDRLPAEPFIKGAEWYRDNFWREVIGKLEEPLLPPNPRTRKAYDTQKFVGYEVVLDVWEGFLRGAYC